MKGRLTAVVVSVAVVGGLVVAATLAVGTANPAVAFAQAGHWVFNRAESAVVHVDSGTRAVDARVAVPGAAADDPAFALQGATQGFLVGRKNITVFGKSSLTVETTLPTGQSELPIGIETVGGPYLVYRQAGTIVRLGSPPTTVLVGGPVDRPVATDDGTVWVHRTDTGTLCSLTARAATLDCTLSTPPGAVGALAVTQGVVGFVDTGADAVAVVQGAGLLGPVGVGTDLPGSALIGDRDSQSRLPVVTTNPNRLVLADDGGVLVNRAGGAPIVVDLGPGTFSGPVAADGVVAVVDQSRNRLLTFGVDGHPIGTAELPPGDGGASIARGADGRLYVDGADGAHTQVVGKDGTITSVATGTPSNAVVSAQPDQLAAIIPNLPAQPTDNITVNVPSNTGQTIPDNTPHDVPQKPIEGGPAPAPVPLPPPPVAPKPPTNVVAAVQADGTVTVTWAGAGDATSYTVSGGGTPQVVPGFSAQFAGGNPGTTYTYTVAATNAGGTSAAVRSNPVTIPAKVGPPGAPTGLNMAEKGQGARTRVITISWNRPNLNGGQLDHYEVTAADRMGRSLLNTTSTTESVPPLNTDICVSPVTVTVRAVTRAGGASQTGPAATATDQAYDCTWDGTIALQASTARSMTIKVTQKPGFPYATATCDMLVNGATRWTGSCSGQAVMGGPITITGLAPATRYTVVMRITQPDLPQHSSNTITVTTPTGTG